MKSDGERVTRTSHSKRIRSYGATKTGFESKVDRERERESMREGERGTDRMRKVTRAVLYAPVASI